MRLDKFLKVSRLIKRRTVANEVSDMGRVFVNGNPAKPAKQIKENDIIAFKIPTGNKATHRVIRITEEGFETKGDANEDADGFITTKETYYGKNIFSIPKLGYVIKATQTKKGKVILITIIIVLLVAGFSIGENKKGKRFKDEESEEK